MNFFEKINKFILNSKKNFIIFAVVMTVLSTASVIYAWFTYEKQLETIAEIKTPIDLHIGAGHNDNISCLDLSSIDVKDSDYIKKYDSQGNPENYEAYRIFSVSSKYKTNYVVQLAYTTNIGFKYEVYSASEKQSGEQSGEFLYTSDDGNTYTYDSTGLLMNSSNYKNSLNGLDATEFAKTYSENYSNVQKHAQPVYMVSNKQVPIDKGYTHYYILKIYWDNSLSNDKETDMIYLSAIPIGE